MVREPKIQLRDVIAGCFPSDARVITLPRQTDLVLAISWRLLDDPGRPAKRSKVILLSVDADLVDFYCLAAGRDRDETDESIAVALRDRLVTFDPDPVCGPEQEPEIVTWRISD